jgi:hypothetical protein
VVKATRKNDVTATVTTVATSPAGTRKLTRGRNSTLGIG